MPRPLKGFECFVLKQPLVQNLSAFSSAPGLTRLPAPKVSVALQHRTAPYIPGSEWQTSGQESFKINDDISIRHGMTKRTALMLQKLECSIEAKVPVTRGSQVTIDISALNSVDEILKIGVDSKTCTPADHEGLLAKILTYTHDKNELKDKRIQLFVRIIAQNLNQLSVEQVTNIAAHAIQLPESPSVNSLQQQIVSFALCRKKAFPPHLFARFLWIMSGTKILNPSFAIHVKSECLSLMNQFGPSDLHQILSALHRMMFCERHLIDLIIERISVELMRFKSLDVERTLRIFAQMGLVRSHVTQELASLAFSNFNKIPRNHLASIGASLARLRFVSVQDFEKILTLVAASPDNHYHTHELVYAANFIDLKSSSHVRSLVKFLTSNTNIQNLSLQQCLTNAYIILFFQLEDLYPKMKSFLGRVFAEYKDLKGEFLIILSEVVSACVVQEFMLEIPDSIKTDVDLIVRNSSRGRSHLEQQINLSATIEQLSGRETWKFESEVLAGPYIGQFMDLGSKVIIELFHKDYQIARVSLIALQETPRDPTSFKMRHRQMRLLGYKPVLLDFWNWKRIRSEDQRCDYIRSCINEQHPKTSGVPKISPRGVTKFMIRHKSSRA